MSIAPAIPQLPLLAFAMTDSERRLLKHAFPDFTSVSLYGSYGDDHQTGVDARDLSRYPAESKSGVFGSLLFDYFPEHDAAIRQAFNVIAVNGVFFTHVASGRLKDGQDPPAIERLLKPRDNYLSYVPADETLPSISVGRDWFTQELHRSGFDATRVSIADGHTHDIEWFVGVKHRVNISNTSAS